MPDTTLLVIDVQESFRHRPYWDEADLARFLDRQQALIDGAVARNVPVVQIFHVEDEGPFSLASGHVRALEPLRIAPDAVFHKRRHSALVGSGLDVWLTRTGIRRLIVSGIRTEQCCETTARHAWDSGWEVDYVLDATLTYDMVQPDGRPLAAADIKARTATVLEGRFAHVCGVDEALARLGETVGA